jgi:hypothetical protein
VRALQLLLLIWFQFSVVTINYRAIAQKRYLVTALSDFVIAICGFTLFKLVQASDASYPDMAGYAIGAVLGGLTGIYLTAHWKESQ